MAQRLRGKSTHSQFANLLLDIFEENERRSLVPVLPNSNDNMQYVMKFLSFIDVCFICLVLYEAVLYVIMRVMYWFLAVWCFEWAANWGAPALHKHTC